MGGNPVGSPITQLQAVFASIFEQPLGKSRAISGPAYWAVLISEFKVGWGHFWIVAEAAAMAPSTFSL